MITISNKKPTDRILELGAGDSPNPSSDVIVDVRPSAFTHFTADFTQPLPIQDSDFTCILAHFVLEHLPYRTVLPFLKECWRVLKPGGDAVFAVPNTAAQLKWVESHQGGWDGKSLFEAASELLYGSQNMPGTDGADHNTHRVYFDPTTVALLFAEAGFVDVVVAPYGERDTDMTIQARKGEITPAEMLRMSVEGKLHTKPVDDPHPDKLPPSFAPGSCGMPEIEPTYFRNKERESVFVSPVQVVAQGEGDWGKLLSQVRQSPQLPTSQNPPETFSNETEPEPMQPPVSTPDRPAETVYGKNSPLQERPYNGLTVAEAFDKAYFNGGGKVGGYAREGYRDFPVHEITARHVLARKPESVLELGCARGYILKRIQDAGVYGAGLEVSQHCYLTRVCEGIIQHDLCKIPWTLKGLVPAFAESGQIWDLCFSIATLEHVPEQYVPAVIKEMSRTCKRGLHGVDFGGHDDGFDKTHVTLRDKTWWEQQFATHAPGWPVEIVDKEELERGEFPPEVLNGDGRVKLNLGSFTTQFHHGWQNIDVHDLAGWSAQNGYKYLRHDIRGGLPFPTAGVDLIFSSHMLEHLTYDEGRRVLSECRRVLKPGGAMRILVPDAKQLMLCWYDGNPHELSYYDEINDQCAAAPTSTAKLWALLHEGHASCYDAETLLKVLEETGFVTKVAGLRKHGGFDGVNHPALRQILHETVAIGFELSLIVDAIPTT